MEKNRIYQSVHFTECEHEGDSIRYSFALTKAGATIEGVDENFEAETCTYHISVEKTKWNKFIENFKKSDDFGLSSLKHY